MNQEAIDLVISNVKRLLELNKIEEVFPILKKEIAPISRDLETPIITNSASFYSLEQDKTNGILTDESYKVQRAQLSARLQGILDSIERELETLRIVDKFKTIYTTNLEKIQGDTNTLVPMNWVYKAIEVSKSVCQVVRPDGNKGTGWLLENGWLLTNHHVIPNKDIASTTKIIFDYEEDLHGSNRITTEFMLDADSAIFSPLLKLDYAYVKVKDNKDNPISNWGNLMLDTFSEPQIGQFVNIIQHPLGQKKQIALTRNDIVAVDSQKLFYKTDTEKGSSGAPVFNSEWKVIALHHAGKTEEEGGMLVNSSTGERMGSNEGILIKYIMEDIKNQLESNVT